MTQIIVDFCRFWKKKWWQNLTFHFLPFYPNSNLAIFFLFNSNFTNLFCFLSNSNSANFISFVSLSNCNFQFFPFFGSTFCLPWTTKILFLVIHLKTGRWPKNNFPWCHDSNAPSFVINESKLTKLLNFYLAQNLVFLAKYKPFSKKSKISATAFIF